MAHVIQFPISLERKPGDGDENHVFHRGNEERKGKHNSTPLKENTIKCFTINIYHVGDNKFGRTVENPSVEKRAHVELLPYARKETPSK